MNPPNLNNTKHGLITALNMVRLLYLYIYLYIICLLYTHQQDLLVTRYLLQSAQYAEHCSTIQYAIWYIRYCILK